MSVVYSYSNGDPTGFGYHADFFNGWKSGVLQNAVDGCNCNEVSSITSLNCRDRSLTDLV